jgi:TonB family protein
MEARVWMLGAAAMLLPGAALAAVPSTAAPPEPPVELDPLTVEGRPPPVPRLRLSPHYPMQAKHRWEEGCVILRFTVRPDGKTDDFAVLDSRPLGVFEKSVIGAVFKWRYEPSDEARTVVEKFEFRNPSLATQPIYSVRNAVHQPIGLDRSGQLRYRLDLQLVGYSPPTCDASRRTQRGPAKRS